MGMNLGKIIKASIAGLISGLSFMIIIPYLLVIINIANDFPIIRNTVLFYLGLIFISIPAFYFWYCARLFYVFGNGTPAPIEPPEKLVSKGVYSYSRNPMYLCYFFIVLGEFFILGYLSLLFYFFILVVFINIYVIFFEEPVLQKRFGTDYLEYKKKVPRWFLK